MGSRGLSLRAESCAGGREGSALRVEGIRFFGRFEGFFSGVDKA